MKIRVSIFSSIIFVIIFLYSTAFAEDITVTFDPQPNMLNPGDYFTVNLQISQPPEPFQTFTGEINYDPAVVTTAYDPHDLTKNVSTQGTLSEGWGYMSNEREPGRFILVMLSRQNIDRSGLFVKILLRVRPDVSVQGSDIHSRFLLFNEYDWREGVIPGVIHVNLSSPVPPSIPDGLQALAVNGYANIHWQVNPPSEDVRSYNLFRSMVREGRYELLATTDGNLTSFRDEDIENGGHYFYKIQAVNRNGESPLSSEVLAYPKADFNHDGFVALTDLTLLQRGINAPYNNPQLDLSDDQVINMMDLGIFNSWFGWETRENNWDAEVIPGEISVLRLQTQPPAPPVRNSAEAVDNYAQLRWAFEGHVHPDIQRFNIYRGDGSQSEFSLIASVEGDEDSYIDRTIMNGRTYYYKISAQNAAGEGLLSKAILASPTSDIDQSRSINTIDLVLLQRALSRGFRDRRCDVNRDGRVDRQDLFLFRKWFGWHLQ